MGKLRVGAAKKCVSPKPKMLPYPQSPLNGDAFFTWIRKDVFIRAIAIDNGKKKIVFVVSELGTPNIDLMKKRIIENYGIKEEDILISNCHNHSAPAPVELNEKADKWGLTYTPNMYEFSKFVIDQTVEAVGEALKQMRPARYGYGKGNSYINVSRDEQLNDGRWIFGRNFERPSDKTLAILKFEDMDGRLIAAILNYAVHSTMCFRVKDDDGNLCVSGDLAGEISAFVEEAFKDEGAVVAWTIAAAANQTPVLEFFHVYHPDGTYEPDERYKRYLNKFMWEMCAHLGQKQGMDALKIMKDITKLRDEMKIEIVDRSFSLPGTKVEGFELPQLWDDRLIDNSKIRNVDIDMTIPIILKLVTLDDIAILGLSFEVMCEIGMRLKEESPLKELVLISLFDKGIGGAYFVDKWGYENHTPSYYRNKVRDAITEEKVTEAMMEMFDERLKD